LLGEADLIAEKALELKSRGVKFAVLLHVFKKDDFSTALLLAVVVITFFVVFVADYYEWEAREVLGWLF
jgi:hypothetical protein